MADKARIEIANQVKSCKSPCESSAVALLGPFKGYLQTDGDPGYHEIVAANGLTPVYCFAHARRYFTDALKTLGLNPNQ